MSEIKGSLLEKLFAPYKQTSIRNLIDYAFQSDFVFKWKNPTAGGRDILGQGVNTSGQLTFGGGVASSPAWVPAIYTLEPTAAILDQNFYIANQAMEVMSIYEIHRVAGSSTPTATIRKCSSGQTIAQGTAVMTGSFDMAGTAATLQTGTVSTVSATRTLAAGDRLAIDYTGTLTAIAGVCVVVFLRPIASATLDVTYCWNANGELIDTQFFVATDRCTVTAVRYSHATLGTNGSAVNVQLVKDTSTNAPGAGTNLLTNNSSAGFNCKATINVPQTGTLSATAADLVLATGDRLSVDFAGTLTALAGLVMTVSLTPISGRVEIPFYIPSVWTTNTDQYFFIADRDYELVIASEVHAIAAGGTSTAQISKDSGTDAPGAGTDLLLAAYDLNGTAQTVDPDLMAAAPYTRRLRAGDRLAIDFGHAVQSSSGLAVTVSLKAI